MKIDFLTNEGLDEKYFQWKDVIIHSILFPLLTITDDRHTFHTFGAKRTDELLHEYGKETVSRIDRNYNRILETKKVFLIQLEQDDIVEQVVEKGYPPDGIFAVWKDDLLKANPITCLSFKAIEPKILMQEKMN